jgi:hypothetical protein
MEALGHENSKIFLQETQPGVVHRRPRSRITLNEKNPRTSPPVTLEFASWREPKLCSALAVCVARGIITKRIALRINEITLDSSDQLDRNSDSLMLLDSLRANNHCSITTGVPSNAIGVKTQHNFVTGAVR